MTTTLMVFHTVVSVLLIGAVLLQFGKGAEVGLFSSGGSSDGVFGVGQGNDFMTKVTIFLSIVYMSNCILLAKLQSDISSKSILDNEVIQRPLNSDQAKKNNKIPPPNNTQENKKTP